MNLRKSVEVKPLSDEEILKEVYRIIHSQLKGVKVYLFGSRAKGTARPNSDFDIALEWHSKIPFVTLAKIREKLEELPTLKSFDIIDLNRVSQEFRNEVSETGVLLNEKFGKEA